MEARVRVDAAQREPLRRIWRYVGYDEPNYTYTPRGRELLGKLGALSDAPYWIRCHFILCSGDGTGRPKFGSSNVYTQDARGNPVYDWKIIDRIFDAIVEAGCIPFVEIGFMPKDLSTAPPEVPYEATRDAGWGYPPRDYGKWRGLIEALARHCLERYGARELRPWYWELWNEPDGMYWQGTVEEFCRLYDYTEAGLHSVLPGAYLGGPATTRPLNPGSSEFLEAFLKHCVRGTNAVTGAKGTRLDYVSFHVKGGRYSTRNDAPKECPTIGHLLTNTARGLDVLSRVPELAGKEVNLSECDPDGWAAGGRHDNPNLGFRNTEYYASYVGSTVCKMIEMVRPQQRVDGMLTWAFEFEDREYFEGLRTLSTNGIDKPVLSVFRMLARLGGSRLRLESDRSRDPLARSGMDGVDTPADISGIAAKDGTGAVQVFLVSHHDDWDVQSITGVSLTVSGLEPGGQYTVRRWVVDRRRGNSYRAWVEMGEPQRPDAAQLDRLRRAAGLHAEPPVQARAGGDGTVAVRFEAEAHSVTLIELSAGL